MSLQSLYTHLLIDLKTPIPEEIQHRIVEHARKSGDTDMLVVLLGRRELTEDADRRIGECAELPVLLTWMLRPGRDPEVVAERAGREKRVAVLAALAETPGLPRSVYENLAEHTSEKVLKALIAGAAADESIRRRAVRGLVSRAPRAVYASTCSTALRDLVNGSESAQALWEEIGTHAVALPYLIAVVEYGNPTSEHLTRWANELEEIHDFDGGRWHDLTPTLVTAIGMQSLTRAQHERLLQTTGTILTEASQSPPTRWSVNLEHVRQLLKTYDIDTEDLLRRLATETDGYEATDLLWRLRQTCRSSQLHRLMTIAVEHPGIALETLVDLRYDLNLAGVRKLAARLDAAGRTDLLEFWLEDSSANTHLPTFVAHLAEPQSFLSRYLERIALEGRTWPAWAIETREVHENPDRAVAHLPWGVLANSVSLVPGLAATVTTALTEHLGNDDEKWRTFEVIGADFEGTLVDLLLAVADLSG